MSFGGLRRTLATSRRAPVDVVSIHTPFLGTTPGSNSRANTAPVVATHHTLFEEYLHHYVPLLPRKITGSMARRFSRSQCNQRMPSSHHRPCRRRCAPTASRAASKYAPTGLPAERFQAGDGSAFRRRHGLDLQQPLLLFVGRAAHEKNIGFLLEMMLELRKLRPDALS